MTKAVTVPLVGRKLARVKLDGFNLGYVPPKGDLHLGFACEIQLESTDGKRDGPIAKFWLAVPADENTSIRDFESAALDRSFEMIQRLSSLGRADLEEALAETKARSREFCTTTVEA